LPFFIFLSNHSQNAGMSPQLSQKTQNAAKNAAKNAILLLLLLLVQLKLPSTKTFPCALHTQLACFLLFLFLVVALYYLQITCKLLLLACCC